jgi:hypothetical protein
MKTIARSLAFAAALAAALPLAVRADHREEDRRHGDRGAPPAHGLPPAAGHGQPHGHGCGPIQGSLPGSRHDWRARELRRIRSEMAALDARRAAYHARWAGRPGKLRKFDRRYLAERAALERQYARLAWTAMR